MKFRSVWVVLASILIVLSTEFFMCGSPDGKNSTKITYPDSVIISNRYFSGVLYNNESNKKRQGAGFTPLINYFYPGQNIYRNDAVGLNFEHIMNGTMAHADISMFTPRKDFCFLRQLGDSSAAIIHPAAQSSWKIDSEMDYQFNGKYAIDIDFSAILRENKFPLNYVGFMWASYMNSTIDRRIYFIGKNQEWVAFGEDTKDGFETGTIGYAGSEPLIYEDDAKTLNIIEHPQKKFTLPFYYGLVHGSGDITSDQDTMVYIMMFDQKESIRFAMWNFFKDSDGKPDTHSPAWDWQYVIHSPKLNAEYHYRARVVYKPFAGREDVKSEYRKWLSLIEK